MKQGFLFSRIIAMMMLTFLTLFLYSCGGSSSVDSDSHQHPDDVNAHVVTIDTQGGEDWGSVSVKDGDSIALAGLETPSKEGFEFLGWSTSADAFEEWELNSPVTSDMTIYAVWDGDSAGVEYHRVTVHLQGGALRNVPVQNLDIDYKSGKTLQQLPRMNVAPDHATLAFGGWNTQPDGRGDYIKPESVMPDKDIDLYAIYGTPIESAEDISAMECNDPNAIYVLTDNIRLSDFTPLCGSLSNPFKSVFIGDFYAPNSAYEIRVNSFESGDHAESKGFFGYTDGAVFAYMGINMPSSGVTDAEYFGGVAGHMKDTNLWYVYGTASNISDITYGGGTLGYGENVTAINENYGPRCTGSAKYIGGFAGYLENSTVKGVTTSSSGRSGQENGSYVGGLVGYMKDSTLSDSGLSRNGSVSSISTDSSALFTSDYTDSYVGGIVGYLDNSSVEGAYDNSDLLSGKRLIGQLSEVINAGAITANRDNSFAGAIAGGMSGGSVIKGAVVSLGASAYGNSSASGVVGIASDTSSISEITSYADMYAEGAGTYTGGIVGLLEDTASISKNLILGDRTETAGGAVAGAFVGYGTEATGNYAKKGYLVSGTPYASGMDVATLRKNKTFFTDTIGWDFAGGLWEMKDHYEYPTLRVAKAPDFVEIKTVDDLKAIGDTQETITKKYALVNDIDASSLTEPIGTGLGYPGIFTGVIDGNGHKITGLNISAGNAGLFDFVRISDSVIRDLTLENVSISEGSGGIAKNVTDTLVERVHVSGSVSGVGTVGGLFGTFSGAILDSSYEGAVSVPNSSVIIGGLVGSLEGGYIYRSYSAGSISGNYVGEYVSDSYAGGLVGKSLWAVEIDSCYSTADITLTDTVTDRAVYAGGIISYGPEIYVKNCYMNGSINNTGHVYDPSILFLFKYSSRTASGGIASWVLGSGSNYITNNVVMSPSISAQSADSTAITDATGRIVGMQSDSAYVAATSAKSSGNYALASLPQGGATEGDEGTDVATADEAFFRGLGWDFEDTWKWDSTDNCPVFQWQ